MIVPLANNANKRADGFAPEARAFNVVVEKDASGISPDNLLRIQRPGLVSYRTVGSPIRGMDYLPGKYEEAIVGGGNLYINGASVGAISGVGLSPMTNTSFYHAVIGGTTLYLYGDTLSTVTLPDAYQAQDVDQLNQYVLVLTTDGSGRFYWIVPGETEVDPLNFATAESSSDNGVAIRRVGDEFVILGTDSGEWWQSTGDLDAPFQKVSGRSIDRGCMSRDTVRRIDNSLMWVADNGEVVKLAAVPVVVSDNALAERIRKRGGDLSAFVYGMDGHQFYVLNVPGQGTFVYDASTSLWAEYGTLDKVGWNPRTAYENAGRVYVGSSTSGKVWQLDATAGTDDGTDIECIITGAVPFIGKAPPNYNVSIGTGSAADFTLRLRWRDGQEDYPAYYDEQEARAPYDVVNYYRMGKPLDPYREYEVSWIGQTRARVAGMTIGQAFG